MRIPLKNYLDKLGLSKLKREQKEIVTSFLNGKDIIGYQLGFEKVYVVTYKSCLKEKKSMYKYNTWQIPIIIHIYAELTRMQIV